MRLDSKEKMFRLFLQQVFASIASRRAYKFLVDPDVVMTPILRLDSWKERERANNASPVDSFWSDVAKDVLSPFGFTNTTVLRTQYMQETNTMSSSALNKSNTILLTRSEYCTRTKHQDSARKTGEVSS